MLKAIIEKVRETNPKKPVKIFINDTPQCDMGKAMQTLDEGVAKIFPDVYIFASAKSFYGRLFPERSMDLIYCITSVHMLSAPAPSVHDHWVFFMSSDMPPLTEATRQWAVLGEKDWETFLLSREQELRPHGRLYVSTHSINKEGTTQSKCMLALSHATKDTLRKSLEKFGWQRYEQDLTIAVISRKLENYKLPFEAGKTKLAWVWDETTTHPDPVHAKLKADVKAAAEFYARLERTYFAGRFGTVLRGKGEKEGRVAEFLDEFFARDTEACIGIMKTFTEDYTGSSIAMIMKKP